MRQPVVTKKRSTTASDKKSTTKKPAARTRKRSTAAAKPDEALIADLVPTGPPVPAEPIVTVQIEPAFAARIAPPPPPRLRPEQRRGIFFDVENTSRPEDIEHVLRYLVIDRVGIDTDFTAVGNWRVIGHEPARILAHAGANLVHSAPSVGVRDWSDLRIAVTAGVWLAGARAGDMLDIVSDDQAFDAVGDVAASLGVQFHRLSYRAITGHRVVEERRSEPASGDAHSRRRRRGGRGRRDGRDLRDTRPRHGDTPSHRVAEPTSHRVSAPAPSRAVAEPEIVDGELQTAPHDELIGVVRGMMATSPGGVTLDQLANALREHGFRRTPGSPRLITRLKRIKEIDVTRQGLIRVVDGSVAPPRHAAVEARAEAIVEPDETSGPDDGDAEAPAADVAGEAGPRRRRRRRGGRRRRGRRGGGGGGGSDAGEGAGNGEVIAAAPASRGEFPEF